MGSRRVRGQGRRKAACSIPTPARLPSCLVQGVEKDSDSVGRAAHAQRATVSPYVGRWSGPGPNSSRGSSYTTAGASVHYWSQLSGWRHLTARLDFFSLYIGREHVISLSYHSASASLNEWGWGWMLAINGVLSKLSVLCQVPTVVLCSAHPLNWYSSLALKT